MYTRPWHETEKLGFYVEKIPVYTVKTAEIGAKIFKIKKMAKSHFSRSDLGSQGVYLGVLRASLVFKSGLRILVRAPEVPFLVPPKW